MIITRDDVIEAIVKEPLYAGSWVAPQEDEDGSRRFFDANYVPCACCAVGAVLRKFNSNAEWIRDTARDITFGADISASGHLKTLIGGELWMNALSVRFERFADILADELGKEPESLTPAELDTIKPDLCAWVLENLPNGVVFTDESA
jgi:hypothetical protein